MPPYRVLRICIKTKEDTVDLTSYAIKEDIPILTPYLKKSEAQDTYANQ
jgi:hypothetical protein